MNPNNSSKLQVLNFILERKSTNAKDIQDNLNISKPTLFKHLKTLLTEREIKKVGTPPKVFYLPNRRIDSGPQVQTSSIDDDVIKYIEENYMAVTPSGQVKNGMEGFEYWTSKTKQDLLKAAKQYYITSRKYDYFKKNGYIDGMEKLKNTFKKVYLDNLFYLDYYHIDNFGKTKLGQMLLNAKQGQNKKIISDLVTTLKPRIEKVIKDNNIDAVIFIPPTIKRTVQFMDELEKDLNLNIPKIQIDKVSGEVIVPQKSLVELEDRIENAQNTFFLTSSNKYGNILILDDAIGSGSSLNEVAAKIRSKSINTGKIIGLAIVGSFSGFDVISEV